MVDKNKAVVCCLLATLTIMLSEKRKRKCKICSKKWYLESIVSCNAPLLNELQETDVPWDDVIVVSAGKVRKLWDSPSEMHSSLCEKTTGNDSSEACAIACQNCVVFSVFPSVVTSHSKIAQFNWECIGHFRKESGLKGFPFEFTLFVMDLRNFEVYGVGVVGVKYHNIGRGRYTVKLMMLKIQGPSLVRAPSKDLTWILPCL